MNERTPRVSIVTATYNRANVLRYTIASVLASTMTDWELLVIGDGTTDDTESMVASFGDPRIRFHNLPGNVGEQSGPNNEGLRRARGRYVAFLNHDDLWFPDHLETALGTLDRTGAAIVFTLGLSVGEGGATELLGAVPGGVYDGRVAVPASLWVTTRAVQQEVGGWRSYRDGYAVPSQNWLMRALRAGHTPRLAPRLTALIVHDRRPGGYAERRSDQHRAYYERLAADPSLREAMLLEFALHAQQQVNQLTVWPWLRRALVNGTKRAGLLVGLSPMELPHLVRYGRWGGFLDARRRFRGLPKLGTPAPARDHPRGHEARDEARG